ncbi:MAG TPA: beta-ketoacyl-ACP synthase II [Thermoleophilaceae bacterium]
MPLEPTENPSSGASVLAEGTAPHRVVITGVGAVTPLGVGAGTLFDRWCAGDVGIENGVGRCSEFDPLTFMSAKEARRTDRFTQLAAAAVQEAVVQAGWMDHGTELPFERVGCFVGTAFGGFETHERQQDIARAQGLQALSALAVTALMPNAAASGIAIRFGLKGPSRAIASACASGGDAIGTAARAIAVGDAEAMVAGGAEASLSELALAGTDKMGALSKIGVSRPFDARRDGFVMAEGAGALILEEWSLAVRRGATLLGEVVGYGSSTDAYHLSAPDPEALGQTLAIRRALADAGVAPEDVDYVNAHGTSTRINDSNETRALKVALGDASRGIPVSSTKSAIGHLVGGSGAVEAAVTVLALRERVVPPTLGYEHPDEGLDLDYVPLTPRSLERWPSEERGRAPLALSNSFGFGGQNACLCLRAWPDGAGPSAPGNGGAA